MKNVWTIIKKEFSRFFKDKRMVITVLLPGVLIYALYSLMGTLMNDKMNPDEGAKYTVCAVNMPENELLHTYLDSSFIFVDLSEDAAKQEITNSKLDLLVIFPEGFDDVLNGAQTFPDVRIFYNSSSDSSLTAYSIMYSILEAFKNPDFSVNIEGDTDLAAERDSVGKLLATVMPMLMFALLVSGCVAVAPEAIAGEKERGTMATMLITPIKRWQLALGKILSLTCFAMLSGLSSFLGVIFSLPKLMGGLISGEAAAFYTAGDYFMILGLIISAVLVIISAFSIISAFAKSVKEAGTMIAPLMIVIILFGVVAMFMSSSPAVGLFTIPLLGSALAMSSILTFSITPLAFVLSIISNLVLGAGLVVALSFMFKSERIMFNK